MDLRLLRYFATVAETGSVARAAEALNVSQSPLSRQIIQFENRLGIALFERVNHRLVLSRDGAEFLERASALLESADALKAFSRDLAAGKGGHLRIGYVEGAVTGGIIERIIQHISPTASGGKAPNASFIPMRSGEQVRALQERRIDMGLAYSPPKAQKDRADIETAVLVDEPILLAVQSGMLPPETEVLPQHLDGKPWIAFPKALNPGFREQFLFQCGQAGFQPDIRYEAATPSVVRSLVASGAGYAFMQASAERTAPPRINFLPVPWVPIRVTVHALWRRAEPGTLLRSVLHEGLNITAD
ncbi:LysR family transcriptional regulator [Sedimenticola sp.]|uniref:LysR family transcriptional regulator n=1 Tax=Sedimenticola sp. TaxID=1940285 RepID=UPI003D10153A